MMDNNMYFPPSSPNFRQVLKNLPSMFRIKSSIYCVSVIVAFGFSNNMDQNTIIIEFVFAKKK